MALDECSMCVSSSVDCCCKEKAIMILFRRIDECVVAKKINTWATIRMGEVGRPAQRGFLVFCPVSFACPFPVKISTDLVLNH
jgi:hypothetical protein